MKMPQITRFKDIVLKKTGLSADMMVESSYHKQGHEQFLKRESVRRAISTLEEWSAERKRIKAAFINAIGGAFPDEKIKVRECGEVRKRNLILKKILFSPFGENWVSGNLYLPVERENKLPVVILSHGHGASGKSSLRERGAFFAANGYAAFSFDYIGGGERNLLDHNGDILSFPSTQHNIVGNRMNLYGYNLQWLMLAENIAAIDYVSMCPEIDQDRICMTGASGGGTETFFTAAVDERIKVLAPAACIRANCGKVEADDTEQVFFNSIASGFDYPDIASFLIAPRPMLAIVNKKDIWSWDQVEYFTAEVARFYKMHSAEEYFSQSVRDRPHTYKNDQVEDALRWFNHHLGNNKELITFENVRQEDIPTEEECLVSEKGNLFLSGFMPPEKVFAEYIQQQNIVSETGDSREIIEEFIKNTLLSRNKDDHLEWEEIDSYQINNMLGRRIIFSPEDGIWIPVEIIIPAKADKIVILLDESPRMTDIEWQLQYASTGYITVRPDMRGFGDIANKESWSDWENWMLNIYTGRRYRLAALAWVIGRNIMIDRAADICALITVLRSMGYDYDVAVHGKCVGGLVGLFAAVADPRIKRLEMVNCIDLYRNHLDERFPLSYGDELVHGILKSGIDIPELREYLSYSGRSGACKNTFSDSV